MEETRKRKGMDTVYGEDCKPTHFKSTMLSMHDLYKKRSFCDIVISVDGYHIPAHRLVISAFSPYFNAMFSGQMEESRQNIVEVKSINSEAMEKIINFAYCAEITVNEGNVQCILSAASMLQISSIQAICSEFLQNHLDPSNCLGIRQFASDNGCFELQDAADKFCQHNFKDIVKCDEFLQLNAQQIIYLIQRDTLNVEKEEEVFNAVMNWIEYDSNKRQDSLAQILEHVRLPLVAWEFLTKRVGNDRLFKSKEDCQRFLHEARQFHAKLYHPDLVNFQFNNSTLRAVPRQSFGQSEYIYVIGGETSPNRTMLDSVISLHPSTREWSNLTPLISARKNAGAAVVDNTIYLVGGYEEPYRDPVKTAVSCNLTTKTWRKIAAMDVARSSVAVLTFDGYIYACGGYDGMGSVSSVETFDPGLNAWSHVQEMTMPRSMAAAVVLRNCIYVFGGYDGISDLNTAEKYDIKQKQWTAIPPMLVHRCLFDATVLNGKIFAVGGCEYNKSLSSVEVFDPSNNSWTLIASLCNPRQGAGVAVAGHNLYALGGYSENNYLSSVEEYNEEKNSWTVVNQMDLPRQRFGCCS